MNFIKKVASSLVLSGLLLSPFASSADSEQVFDKINIDYQTFTLPNGLTTLVHSDHSVPNVYVGVWYRVGSKDEPAGKTGFAHLFEHLMFQETPNRKGEYFAPFIAAGAVGMNGTTNLDRTNYFETVPSNALDMALWMESDRMGHLGQGITQKLLDEQRAVVKNEKRQGQLQPGAEGYDRFVANFYPKGHPYDHTTIGSMTDLDNATLDDVKAWFKDNYGAANAVLVLSGDIDLASAKQKVGYYFGDVPAGKPINRIDQWVPALSEVKRDILYGKVGSASISRTWPLPNGTDKDTNLMEIVGATLAGSQNALLNKVLVDELQLATGVQAGVDAHQVSSTFTISVGIKPGVSVQAVSQALDSALARYFKDGPSQARLNDLSLGTNIAMLRSLESNAAVGDRLISGYVLNGDPLFFNKQRQWLASAKAKAIRDLAKKWLSKPYYESQMLPLPQTSTQQQTVDRAKIPTPGPFKGEVKFPAISEATLANGMKLVVAQRHGLPIVDASLVFNTGSLAEQPYGPGVAGYAFELLTSGSRRYDTDTLADKMDAIGTNISARSGKYQSSVSWSALDNYLEPAFALAAEVTRHPSYPQKELDKLKTHIATSYAAYEQNPINAASAIYADAIWGKAHPFGHIASKEEALAFSRDNIQAFHDHEVGPNNATLYLIGDITLDKAKALAKRYFGDWQKIAPSAVDHPAVANGSLGKVILVDAPGAVQSSIAVGKAIAPFDKDKAATDLLMNAALGGGFQSRLNMNLREDKGWAYGFSSYIDSDPHAQRVFTASGTVQADKTAASMVEIQKEIQGYAAGNPISAQELARDKTSTIHSIPNGFTNNGSYLASMINSASFGLPYNRAEGAVQRLQQVTLEAVRAQAKATFGTGKLTWVVVGDLSQIEKDIRALKLGPVEVWDTYGNKLR